MFNYNLFGGPLTVLLFSLAAPVINIICQSHPFQAQRNRCSKVPPEAGRPNQRFWG
jgi:hypothetical protein